MTRKKIGFDRAKNSIGRVACQMRLGGPLYLVLRFEVIGGCEPITQLTKLVYRYLQNGCGMGLLNNSRQ